MLERAFSPLFKYRYRKPEPKAPTHEEIMTKWWKHWDGAWSRVFAYFSEDKEYGLLCKRKDTDHKTDKFRSFVSREYFINRESADIPPEA